MKFIIRKFIKYLFVPFGILYKIWNNNDCEVIILMYHRVNDDIKKELSVEYDNFKWHMNYLKRKNYKVISLDELYNKILCNNIDDNYIVLTFDDGYEDFYYNAFPTLKKYNFKSTLYIVPGFIEKNKVFWWDEDLNKSELLTWKMIKELKNSGIVDIGNHTLNHKDLDKLNYNELFYEINKSKEIIENNLNIEVKHFSYPRGIYNKNAYEIINESHKTGVLITNGKKINNNIIKKDLLKLKRVSIQRSDGKYLFIARINGLLIIENLIKNCIKFLKQKLYK